MARLSMRRVMAGVLAAGLAISVAACGGDPAPGGAEGGTLVVDRAFDIKTVDPGRTYEHSGNLVVHQLYETLLTFQGGDVAKPIDGLASMTANDTNTEFTFDLKADRKFSDGSTITADDVVFSLTRVQGMKGSPSFLLDGVTIKKVDEDTVQLTTAEPMPQLPSIIPNPALSIVNEEVVKSNGGTTDAQDKAESFLNRESAGSGPYKLETMDLATQVVMVANPEYNGPKKITFDRIVLRNVESATQAVNIKGGDSMIVTDLSGDQVEGLPDGVKVLSGPSANVVFLLLNQNPDVNKWTANADFMEAVRLGVDYPALLEVAGKGSVQAAGIIPSMFAASLPSEQALKHNLDAAKAALARSGYDGSKVTLNYPNDVNLNGVEFTSLAERIQAQLRTVGINADLAPAPVATELDKYRGGKEVIGMWYWGPDYPDPADYLVFTPGQMVGLRAQWKAGADPELEALVKQAPLAKTDADRVKVYHDIQLRLNEKGAFIPLLQPAVNLAYASNLTGVEYNAVWTIDFADIGRA